MFRSSCFSQTVPLTSPKITRLDNVVGPHYATRRFSRGPSLIDRQLEIQECPLVSVSADKSTTSTKHARTDQTKKDDMMFQLICMWGCMGATNRRRSPSSLPADQSARATWGTTISRQWRCRSGTLESTLPFCTAKPSGLRILYG